jgi:uncharacterized YigZ family protein
MGQYLTVKNQTQYEFIEKKSKFIANVAQVKSEAEAVDFINKIKAKYWDATHNVFAYIIKDEMLQKFSDDGEPKGTAGMPVLQVIKNLELQNTAVVVTRYFGGILLGAGGLVRAYSKSASEGLKTAGIIKSVLYKKVKVQIEYSFLGKIQSEIMNLGYIIKNINYIDSVQLEVLIPEKEIEKLRESVNNIISGEAHIDVVGSEYVLLDIDDNAIRG